MSKITTYMLDRQPVKTLAAYDIIDFSIQGRFRRLKTIIFRFAIWLCKPWKIIEDRGKVHRIAFKEEKLFEMVRTHVHNFMEMQRKSPLHLVVGPDQWMQIAEEVDRNSFLGGFTTNTELPIHYGQSFRYLNMKVTMVPWIDGAFVMPIEEK